MTDIPVRWQIRLFFIAAMAALVAFFVSLRWIGTTLLKGKQRVQWIHAFEDIASFVKSRNGWLIITFILLAIGLIIAVAATALLE